MAWNPSGPKYLLASGWTALIHLRIHYATLQHLQRESWAMCFAALSQQRHARRNTVMWKWFVNISWLLQTVICMHQLGLSQSKCSKIPPTPKEDLSTDLIPGGWMGGDSPAYSEVQPAVDALIPRTGSKWEDLCHQNRSPSCPFLSGSLRMGLSWKCECTSFTKVFLHYLIKPYPQNVENIELRTRGQY